MMRYDDYEDDDGDDIMIMLVTFYTAVDEN